VTDFSSINGQKHKQTLYAKINTKSNHYCSTLCTAILTVSCCKTPRKAHILLAGTLTFQPYDAQFKQTVDTPTHERLRLTVPENTLF